jgi:hypothetical protein
MAALQVISYTYTPLVKLLWTFKEAVNIKFTIHEQPHELELLHITCLKEVFVLLDQFLVAKLNRMEIEKQPAKIDVRGATVLLGYREGSFRLEQTASVLTATTEALGGEAVCDSRSGK